MSYLTGKRTAHYVAPITIDEENIIREGVIISEPFPVTNQDGFDFTGVPILWDDGTISGRIDVEELKILDMSVCSEKESQEACIVIPKRIFDILTSDIAQSVARHGYKCPSGFDNYDEDGGADTSDFYDAICELKEYWRE